MSFDRFIHILSLAILEAGEDTEKVDLRFRRVEHSASFDWFVHIFSSAFLFFLFGEGEEKH